jgi:uncharacterized membrane protein
VQQLLIIGGFTRMFIAKKIKFIRHAEPVEALTASILRLIFLTFSFTFTALTAAPCSEHILSLHSDIVVNVNASIDVTETIVVKSAGQCIKRGIFREFPTRYKDRHGNNVVVDFKLNDVQRNGKPTPYVLKDKANGKIIEIGDDSFIAPGKHTYTISYTTNRQLGFYKEYDELYWNVTGNGWRFPIAQASARIHLPAEIPQASIKTDGYTGSFGATEKNYRVGAERNGSLFFETTKPLEPQEGFTIVAIWQKGFITEPDWQTKWRYFFKDNFYLLWALVGFILLLLFLFYEWRKTVARNQQETVIPQFYPPEGLSAGAVYYINTMNLDDKAFAAEIVELAVRGFLIIEYKQLDGFFSNDDSYTLIKNKNPINVPTDQEKLILGYLFDQSETVTINKEKKIMEKVFSEFKYYMREFFDHYLRFKKLAFFYCIIIFIFLIAVPLALHDASIFQTIAILVLFLLFLVFNHIFPIYSDEGLKIKALIDGFKMFLQATESERLKIIGTPPTKTPQLYEKYLPYAMALGVEKAWSQQFAPVFARLEKEGIVYVPIWYRGRKFSSFDSTTFASDLKSSFGSSIAASSTPPGSRSGFGGGSSGGGGGGGGGGGR